MPIDWLVVKDEDASFPKMGDLRLGDPKRVVMKGGKAVEYVGKDTDHFRFVSEYPGAAEKFKEVYGDAPASINVYLPYETVGKCFEFWLTEYSKNQLVHACTGSKMVKWRENGKMVLAEDVGPKPCPYAHMGDDPKRPCKPEGILYVMVAELWQWALVWVHTGSDWNIIEIQRNLKAIGENNLVNGKPYLKGVPVVLHRVKRMVSCPMPDGSRVRQPKWLIAVEAFPGWVQVKQAAFERAVTPHLITAGSKPESVFDVEVIDAEIETEQPKSTNEPAKPEPRPTAKGDAEPPAKPEAKPEAKAEMPTNGGTGNGNGHAKLLERALNIADGKGVDADALSQEKYQKDVAELSPEEAADFVAALQKLPPKTAATPREALAQPKKGGKGKTDAPAPPPTAAAARVPEPLPPVELNPRSEKQQALQDHLESLVGTGDTARFHSMKEAWVEVNALLKRKTANQWAAADARSIDDDLCDWLIPNLPPF